MYCASCPHNVENALKDTPGVVNVTVGFVGKEIINGTVEGRGEAVYDTTKTNPDKMLQAILPHKGAIVSDARIPPQTPPPSVRISFKPPRAPRVEHHSEWWSWGIQTVT